MIYTVHYANLLIVIILEINGICQYLSIVWHFF